MISPNTWRELVRPHHARLTELAHSRGVPVMYHCDGAIYPLIPELIDLGVDLLNPVAEAAESQRAQGRVRRPAPFHGGVDILRSSRPARPTRCDEVVRLVDTLGRGGGFVLCSSHHLQRRHAGREQPFWTISDPALRYRS